MSNFRSLMESIRELSVETLSDAELDEFKELIIKLLVDIQIQKDINARINEKHSSTDDIQVQIMQRTTDRINDVTEKQTETITEKNKTEVSYQEIMEEKLSEELISIYSASSNVSNIDENSTRKEEKNNEAKHGLPINKLNFGINDKFRIVKKLFKNNTQLFDEFVSKLNEVEELSLAENLIKEYGLQNKWDEKSFEYQLLLKQNKKRFNSYNIS